MGVQKGRVNLLNTPLNDFNLILGNEFFMKEKVMVLSHLNGLFFMDETQPCFVWGLSKVPKKGKPSRERKLSTTQVQKGLEKNQRAYVATLMGSKSNYVKGIPNAVLQEV